MVQKPTLDAYLHGHELSLRGRIRSDGVRVMGDERMTVSTIRVNHGQMPSVGYRFETPDLKIVFSGDRGDRGDDLARFARGADVLFHEISDLEVDHQIHDHSGGELVGFIARTNSLGDDRPGATVSVSPPRPRPRFAARTGWSTAGRRQATWARRSAATEMPPVRAAAPGDGRRSAPCGWSR